MLRRIRQGGGGAPQGVWTTPVLVGTPPRCHHPAAVTSAPSAQPQRYQQDPKG
ncbi:hypothetical protein D8674_042019 [Pyrus ussuriensis x Pyrus communis]|uniref:Uncharacterized protein n=1 Tax=Pyrus ussuriensis x Pyrus communis TaxID=2448454 RepID=A0A5N5HYI2_9ROSA|nr:hypothetical protein D8674_042019 [Pyrus ussuriensis x Pyrus communis]